MSCIQRSSCTLAKCQGSTAIAVGLAIITIIPLIIGCLGKYHVLSIGRPLSQGMIVSGSLGTAIIGLCAFSAGAMTCMFRAMGFPVDWERWA